jgi:hypothetical protein
MAVEARNKAKAIHPLIACPDLVCLLGVRTWIEELQATGVYSIRFGEHAMAVDSGIRSRRCYVAQFALFDNAFMRFSRTFDSILILPLITRQSPRNLIVPGRAGISRGSPVIDHLANLERVVWHGILLAANAFRDDRLRPRSNPFGKKAVTQKARAVKHDDPH